MKNLVYRLHSIYTPCVCVHTEFFFFLPPFPRVGCWSSDVCHATLNRAASGNGRTHRSVGRQSSVWRLLAPTLLHLLFLAIFNVLAIAMNTVFLYIYIHTHTHWTERGGYGCYALDAHPWPEMIFALVQPTTHTLAPWQSKNEGISFCSDPPTVPKLTSKGFPFWRVLPPSCPAVVSTLAFHFYPSHLLLVPDIYLLSNVA